MAGVQGHKSSFRTNGKQMEEGELDLRELAVRKDEDYHLKAALTSRSGTMAGTTRVKASHMSTSRNDREIKDEHVDDMIDLTTQSPSENSMRDLSRIHRTAIQYHRIRGKGKLPVFLNRHVGKSSIVTFSPEPSTEFPSERTRYMADMDARSKPFNDTSVSGSEATVILENARLPSASFSSDREDTLRIECKKEGEQLMDSNFVQHFPKKSERVLPIKRRRSSLMNSRQRFRPPRALHNNNASESTSGAMQVPIEIDDLESPTTAGAKSDSSSQDMQRQIDEDEILAKMLQEEYSLGTSGVSSFMEDAQLARLLQEEETSITRWQLQSNFHTDDAQFARMLQEEENAYMQLQPQSSSRNSNTLVLEEARREVRRVLPTFRSPSGTSASTSSRMRILRNLHNRNNQHLMRGRRLGGRAVNDTEGVIHFPEGVDLDTRLGFLGVMESASQGILPLAHVDRDFNENDYEMLLALDDGNNSCRGASYDRIERLPVSVVKPTDVCEETCSICLEIPVVGNLVRRLPCMHGFHQQCIDVWLQQQASCPICKVSF